MQMRVSAPRGPNLCLCSAIHNIRKPLRCHKTRDYMRLLPVE